MKESDSTWYEHIITGNGWELLDAKMDEEEPDASLDISVALSKRNEAARSTGHAEIFRALVELCKPDPRTTVAGGPERFDEIRSRMIDLYGSAADHPDLSCPPNLPDTFIAH